MLFACALHFASCAASATPLLPGDKETILLEPGERNPFARRTPAIAQEPSETESEENQIIGFLKSASVSGYTESEEGRTVLVAGQKLAVGSVLAPVIRNQTETVRVQNIHPDRVEFVFLEPDDKPPTRTFTIKYSLAPKVRYLLPSQVPIDRSIPVQLDGVFPPTNPDAEEPQQ